MWDKHIGTISKFNIIYVVQFPLSENNIYLIFIFLLSTNHDFGRWKPPLIDSFFLYKINWL